MLPSRIKDSTHEEGSPDASEPESPSVYQLGACLRVDRASLHSQLRRNFVETFRARSSLPIEDHGVALFQGGKAIPLYNTDTLVLFRQESYFHYLFGVEVEGFWGAIDIRTLQSILFMPRLPASYAVWMGHLPTPEEIKDKYAVEEVRYVTELPSTLSDLAPPCLHLLSGVDSDSGLPVPEPFFDGIEGFELERAAVWPVLTDCRATKSSGEVAILRYACAVASRAHVAAMRAAAPGRYEFQLEALYLQHIYAEGGCRTSGSTPVVASGPNAAVLHYGHAGAPNSRQLAAGDLVLLDAGAQYYRYVADVACTFPVGGKFGEKQRVAYEAALAARQAVLGAMKPGVGWVEVRVFQRVHALQDMHLLAERALLHALRAVGLLRGDVDAMAAARLGAAFMPHGVGHLVGLDLHDVGGYLPGYPPRPLGPGLSALRTARLLEPGMVIAVEPGCYFSRALLLPALEDPVLCKFLEAGRLQELMGMGGARLEDCVLVTDEGIEVLSHLPRSVEEVEAVMAGAPWETE